MIILNLATRFTDALNEYWQKLIDVSPKILLGIAIISISFLIANGIQALLNKWLGRRAKDPLTAKFIARIIKWALILIAIALGLDIAGLGHIASGLLAGAGVGALILGFAFKDIGENFLAGIILAFDRPFDLGDTIEVGSTFGKVQGLQSRVTHIKTFDSKDIYIPNSTVVKTEVINYTRDGFLRQDFVLGIDPDDDVTACLKLIEETLKKVDFVLDEPKPFAIMDEFGTSTINLKVLFWVNTFDYSMTTWEMKSRVMQDVKKVVQEAGFGMPADVKELKIYKPDQPIPVVIKGENKDLKQ